MKRDREVGEEEKEATRLDARSAPVYGNKNSLYIYKQSSKDIDTHVGVSHERHIFQVLQSIWLIP